MKKLTLLAVPVLSLAVMGAVSAGGMRATECRACELEESPVAVCRDDGNDYTQSGVDNFLPDDDVFCRDGGGFDGSGRRDDRKPPRPEPRDRDGNKRRPTNGEGGESSPNGDIYFVIYGHLPVPPAPQPQVPDHNGGEIPEAELG